MEDSMIRCLLKAPEECPHHKKTKGEHTCTYNPRDGNDCVYCETPSYSNYSAKGGVTCEREEDDGE
jgi:hypothetical protein